jgi:hypothetical protein
MSKIALAPTTVLLGLILLLVVGMQGVEVADANPFDLFTGTDPVPGAVPPTIIMLSPTGKTEYTSDNVTVSFYVSKPQLASSWSSILFVYYSLDGNEDVEVYGSYKSAKPEKVGVPEFNTTFTLPPLSAGEHSLTVKAEGMVAPGVQYNGYHSGGGYSWFSSKQGLQAFSMNSNSTTYFTVATQPTQQPSATSTTSQSTTSNWLSSGFLAPMVSVLVTVAVVASLLIVYFRQHKRIA